MKGVKHYTEDGEYKGETHKMDGEVHTGAKHSDSSKVVSHKPDGPFKMNASPFDAKKGLWANIHAKRKRIKAGSGEKMRKPGSKGSPSAKDLKDSQN
jgi:hypothetical protein